MSLQRDYYSYFFFSYTYLIAPLTLMISTAHLVTPQAWEAMSPAVAIDASAKSFFVIFARPDGFDSLFVVTSCFGLK
jgi:hypothetical protein